MKYSKHALILCFASLITSTTLLNAAQAPAMPAPKADVYVVPQAQDLAISLKYPAEIKAYKKVQVVSRVLGTLEKQYFTEGSSVKQGDVLYKIEDGIYKAKYDAALATLNMNQAILDNASRNWERIKKLYAQQAVSEEKKYSAIASLSTARNDIEYQKAILLYEMGKEIKGAIQ
jgi:membrane fusion protein (multidrug efflux system)